MNQMSKNTIKGSLLVFSLVIIAGCDFFKKKDLVNVSEQISTEVIDKNDGIWLCKINDSIALTEQDFLNDLNQIIQSNPYFRGATADSLPKELQRKFLDQSATQRIIEAQAIKNGIENDPEYIKSYKDMEKLLKRSLMVQSFEKKMFDEIKVSDDAVADYYEKNKGKFIKTPGGVSTLGVSFDNDTDAQVFLDLVKSNSDTFEAVAKEQKNGKFKDFGLIAKEVRGQQYDMVPSSIKDAVVAMHKFPTIEKIKAGKEVWVIKASGKKNAEFFPLAEIAKHVEAMIKNEKYKKVFEDKVIELKKDFKLTVNEDYFKDVANIDKGAQEGSSINDIEDELDNDGQEATA